jgi:hypothetical protein
MTDILSGVLGLLFGNLTQLTDNLLAIGLMAFSVSLGFFAITYLNRRRQMLHQERMASLIKGLHYAGVAHEVFAKKRKREARDHVLSGLRWVAGGAGVASAMYGYEAVQPSLDAAEAARGALIGIIPATLGIAQLAFGWVCSRRDAANGSGTSLRRFLQSRTAGQPQVPRAAGFRPGYRPAARRDGVPYSV